MRWKNCIKKYHSKVIQQNISILGSQTEKIPLKSNFSSLKTMKTIYNMIFYQFSIYRPLFHQGDRGGVILLLQLYSLWINKTELFSVKMELIWYEFNEYICSNFLLQTYTYRGRWWPHEVKEGGWLLKNDKKSSCISIVWFSMSPISNIILFLLFDQCVTWFDYNFGIILYLKTLFIYF